MTKFLFLLNKTRLFSAKRQIIISNVKYSVQSDLLHKLLSMPRESKHTTELKMQRQRRKEKGSKYVPGTVTIQVLGSGAEGAPRSLYMFTDQSRYLFNCGEGSQRLAHEHKMKLSKLEHIFITYPSWENIGGLPGVALTIQDVGVPEITLHGPAGTDEIFSATRRFVILKDLSIRMAQCDSGKIFEDNVMTVEYIPLYKQKIDSHNSKSEIILGNDVESSEPEAEGSSDTEDEIDYYAHERNKNGSLRISKKKDRSQSEVRNNSFLPKSNLPMSMCYVCRLKDRPGTLSLVACVERGVPPGPLLGKLKNGEDIVLENGNIVKSCEVTTPDDPGPVFVVVECPSLDYLDSLLKEPVFHKHQANASSDRDSAYCVIHFTPPSVMEHPIYQNWMNRFIPSTKHIVINSANKCMGSTAVHRIQYQLNLLEPSIFPLLSDSGIPCEGEDQSQVTVKNCSVPLLEGRTFCSIHLRPRLGYDDSNLLYLTPTAYVSEPFQTEEFQKELVLLKDQINNHERCPESDYPKLVFLGTGSCIPNKTRNTSGILIFMNESESILLDSGESTYGQIVRLFGRKRSEEILVSLKAIYISHLHADHHIGLIGVLNGRKKALKKLSEENKNASGVKPIYLLAPRQIMSWLNLYHKQFEPILEEFELVPNSELDISGKFLARNADALNSDLSMKEVKTVLVKHCPYAFGVSLIHKDGWKITYSGDTKPCEALVKLGQNSDVLIHEATMEDELEHEAKVKLHSTTSQAITVGQQMNAKFILLTHFSQRYAKLPRLNESFTNNVGIAFDNMQVSVNQLPLLPKMYPALKLMFAEQCEELEAKAFKRQLRQERKRAASKSPDRNVKISV